MAGQDAELGNLAFTHLAGRHLSRIGERLPGAVVSLHEWSELRVIGHTWLSPRNMFVIHRK